MSEKIVITGIGMISAIGVNVPEALLSLQEERTGIGEITHLDTLHKGKFPIAEVKRTDAELLAMTGNAGSKRFTRTSLLGMIAAREALESAGILRSDLSRTALVSATTVGGMDRSEGFFSTFLENDGKGKLSEIVNHDCGDSTERIAAYTGIGGFRTTISTACSSSANAIMFGAALIQAGIADRVVAGGADSVTKFTLNGFNTLMILDKNRCRPFDDTRAGLTLGEAGAFVVLEREAEALAAKRTIHAILAGYGNANDAYHQTASSPEGTGATLAMKAALQMAGLTPGAISYINVHGTGTQNNDLSEGTAITNVFGRTVPPFSSTKAFTGHTLGAAGSVEAVIAILAIRHGMIFPNLHFTEKMKELDLTPVTKLVRNAEIRTVLSNSFGFGGNNSTLILSKHE